MTAATPLPTPRPRHGHFDLTPEEVAAELRVPRRYVLDLVRGGVLPAYALKPAAARKRWRIRRADLDAFKATLAPGSAE